MTKNAGIEAQFSQYPEFKFKLIPDGLPKDHLQTGSSWIFGMLQALRAHAEPFLRDILKGSDHKSQQVTC